MKKINQFPEKLQADLNDFLLVQDVNGITQKISKENLFQGVNTNSSTESIDPTLTTSGLIAYWNSENVVENSGFTEQLIDISGNENHAVNTNSYPFIKKNAINNYPAVEFTGNEFFVNPVNTVPRTIIACLRSFANGNHSTLLGGNSNDGSEGAYYFKTDDTSGEMKFILGGTYHRPSIKAINSEYQFYIQSLIYHPNKLELFVNNALVDSAEVTEIPFSYNGNSLLGAGYYNNSIVDYFVGDLCCMALFDIPINYDGLYKIITYLKGKYL